MDKTLTTSPTICQVGDTIYWRHHSNLIVQAQVMRAIMATSPDAPIVYNIMLLTDAESRFQVPHHDIFLDNSTPTYDPSSLAPDEIPLTAVERLQMAAHPGFSAQDIIRWYPMEPKKLKWLPLAKDISEIVLDNDSPIAI